MRIKLGIPFKLSFVADCLSGELNVADRLITHISTDTRDLFPGDLFVAIADGRKYIEEAKSIGAFVVSSQTNSSVEISDDTEVLPTLAKNYVKKLPYILYKIAITGSVGKTTTKEFTKIILSERFKVHSNEGNYNNHIGLPMSILSAPWDTQILLMEMGMNHHGEIEGLSKCLEPDIGIITNIGSSHIGNLGSREAIAEAKLEVLKGMNNGQLFIPLGEPLLMPGAGRSTVSHESLDADYTLIYQDGDAILFNGGDEIYRSPFALCESHHLKALAFATSLGSFLGMLPEELGTGTSQISTDNTRQTTICRSGYHFVADCYNSSYESVLALIEAANLHKELGESSVVIGDILELGEYCEAIHRMVGVAVGEASFRHVFLFGENAKYLLYGIESTGFPPEFIHVNEDLSSPEITADQIKRFCQNNEVIYMKASRSVRLERILDYFN